MWFASISICSFGTVGQYAAEFSDGWNEIDAPAASELAAALQLLLRNKPPSGLKYWIRDGTKIEAAVKTEQADYRVVLTPEREGPRLKLAAYDPTGADRTPQYLRTVAGRSAENERNIFHGGDRNIYFALKRCDGEGKCANDVLWSQAFHSYRRRYVTGFPPIPMGNGTFLSLREDGSFAVEDARRNLCTGQLSETEERLARYLCFLQVAAFWDGFEQIRNMHYERKPLILLDFLEFLDASVLANDKLRPAENFDRQILALTSFSL